MKVVILINTFGAGGAERSLLEMLPYFSGANVSLVLVYMHGREIGVERQVFGQDHDIRLLRGSNLLRRVISLRRLLAEERPELLHTTLFEANFVGRLAAMRTAVPVLTSLVNTPYEPVRLKDPNVTARKLSLVRKFDSWTSRFLTTHFHAITEAVKHASVKELGIPPERITVVERGRDPVRLGEPGVERRRRARRLLGVADDAEVLVNVGRQEYQKGQVYLLEAMSRLVEERPRLQLLVAGRKGRATPELEALCRQRGLGDRVRFLGFRDDVPEILAAADVFVFPSLYEGLGGAVIEAMALGLPLVVSRIPALQEVTEEHRNALHVEPESPAELAGAIRAVLDDKAMASGFGKRSREIFEARFTIARSTRRMLRLYQQVAESGRSGTSSESPQTAQRARHG